MNSEEPVQRSPGARTPSRPAAATPGDDGPPAGRAVTEPAGPAPDRATPSGDRDRPSRATDPATAPDLSGGAPPAGHRTGRATDDHGGSPTAQAVIDAPGPDSTPDRTEDAAPSGDRDQPSRTTDNPGGSPTAVIAETPDEHATAPDRTEDAAPPASRRRPSRAAAGQIVFGVVCVAAGVAALVDAAGLAKFGKSGQPGPGLFPDLVALLLVVLGIWLTVLSIIRPERTVHRQDDEAVDPRGFRRAVAVWLGFVVSLPLLVLFGFAPAMAALVAFLVFGVERIRGLRPVLAVVLVPALVYLLFSGVLGVELPESALFST